MPIDWESIRKDPMVRAFQDVIDRRRRVMSAKTKVQEAQAATVAAAQRLVAHRARVAGGDVPPEFAKSEEARLTAAFHQADALARSAVAAYREESADEAGRLRAAAEASVAPAQRAADVAELQYLAASSASPERLAQRAMDMCTSGQSGRASLLAEAARARGFKFDREWESALHAALDEDDSDRRKARDLEREVVVAEATFAAGRLTLLQSVGMADTGDRMAAWLAAQDAGVPYADPTAPVEPGARIVP